MKTSDLIGPALDWAVAKCEGVEYLGDHICDGLGNWHEPTCYSAFWAQGGPIIEREKIGVYPSQSVSGVWAARPDYKTAPSAPHTFGPTPLVAAMRCYVASKLGDKVELPEELL